MKTTFRWIAFLILAAAAVSLATAQTETVLYNFCSQPNCTDGQSPFAGVVIDKKDNLYGTTYDGGANGLGVVYKLTPAGVESVLYNFCSQSGCSDGGQPYAGLLMDKEGNFYGTTVDGGNAGNGTVFELTATGEETVLYRFCSQPGCSDGSGPYGGVIMDSEGNFYGTTAYGGANGGGVVFKLSSSGEETVLWSFEGSPSDGSQPYSTLVRDKKGNLYGTTAGGGTTSDCQFGCGTIFKIASTGAESILYYFQGYQNSGDGMYPWAGLIMDKKDNLYGTTTAGGQYNGGDVFELSTTGVESILYSFQGYGDGSTPYASLLMGKKDSLYGVSSYGNGNYYGAAVELTPGAEGEPWNFSVLHTFEGGGDDGLEPYGTLIFDKKGNLYGTTAGGGCNGCDGTVFKITP
jgi:uncharacterized repeat protein (TIGR03803 family)